MWQRQITCLGMALLTAVTLAADKVPAASGTSAPSTTAAQGCLSYDSDDKKIDCLQQQLEDLTQRLELYRDTADKQAAATRKELLQALADGIYAPPKTVKPFNNIVAATEMWWGDNQYHGATNLCYDKLKAVKPETKWDAWFQEHVPDGSVFFVVEEREDHSPGCKTGPTCDSLGEHCITHTLVSGCYVNKAWLDWYQRRTAAMGQPLSKEFVCKDPKSSQ